MRGLRPSPFPACASASVYTDQLVNLNSGKCLEVADWGRGNGAAVRQWACGGGQANQTWY